MKCELCNGSGEVYYSCCTSEVIDSDQPYCPVCKEHLGLEPCDDCSGTGLIKSDSHE